VVNLEVLGDRHDTIELLMRTPELIKTLREVMARVRDLPRLLARLQLAQGRPELACFSQLHKSLSNLLVLRDVFGSLAPRLGELQEAEGDSALLGSEVGRRAGADVAAGCLQLMGWPAGRCKCEAPCDHHPGPAITDHHPGPRPCRAATHPQEAGMSGLPEAAAAAGAPGPSWSSVNITRKVLSFITDELFECGCTTGPNACQSELRM
jgi:hypothetical protein